MGFDLKTDVVRTVSIKVAGIGDAGCSVISQMVSDGVQNVTFIAINTDKQALGASRADMMIQISKGSISGQETAEKIRAALKGTDLLFIAAGMGGDTGTSTAPIVAEIAREMNILTIAMVTKPLSGEGSERIACAEQGIAALQEKADSLIVIPCGCIQKVIGSKDGSAKVFEEADRLLKQGITSITELLLANGFINLDFEDVCLVFRGAGSAHMGVGRAAGEDKADAAADMVISDALLGASIVGARAAIVNFTAPPDISLSDANLAAMRIEKVLARNAEVFWGIAFDDTMTDELQVTVIATGFESHERKAVEAAAKPETRPAQGVVPVSAGKVDDDSWPDLLSIFK